MDRWLSLIPKGLLAILAIGGGMAFIILSSPPHTLCESQIEVFRESQKRFLFLNEKKKAIVTTKYQLLIDTCKETNDPGGCYELFHEMRSLLKDLEIVPAECLSETAAIPEVKKAILDVADLMVKLGWGEKPPTTYFEKFGRWPLDRADMSLFCWIHRIWGAAYGEPSWKDFSDKIITTLPGADTVMNGTGDVAKGHEDLLDMSILSENCAQYP